MSQTRRNDLTRAALRDDYLDGLSQPVLAARYGVGMSTIRDRARREGWRRRDHPAPPVPPLDGGEVADAEEAHPMRPVVAVVADAYRQADIARLLLRNDWLRGAGDPPDPPDPPGDFPPLETKSLSPATLVPRAFRAPAVAQPPAQPCARDARGPGDRPRRARSCAGRGGGPPLGP